MTKHRFLSTGGAIVCAIAVSGSALLSAPIVRTEPRVTARPDGLPASVTLYYSSITTYPVFAITADNIRECSRRVVLSTTADDLRAPGQDRIRRLYALLWTTRPGGTFFGGNVTLLVEPSDKSGSIVVDCEGVVKSSAGVSTLTPAAFVWLYHMLEGICTPKGGRTEGTLNGGNTNQVGRARIGPAAAQAKVRRILRNLDHALRNRKVVCVTVRYVPLYEEMLLSVEPVRGIGSESFSLRKRAELFDVSRAVRQTRIVGKGGPDDYRIWCNFTDAKGKTRCSVFLSGPGHRAVVDGFKVGVDGGLYQFLKPRLKLWSARPDYKFER